MTFENATDAEAEAKHLKGTFKLGVVPLLKLAVSRADKAIGGMQPVLQGLRPVGLCLDTALQFLDAWSNADEALVKAEGEVKIRDYIVSTLTSASVAKTNMLMALDARDPIDRLTKAARLAHEYAEIAKGGADHTMKKVASSPGSAPRSIAIRAQVDAYWEAVPKSLAVFQQQFAEAFAKLSGYEGAGYPGLCDSQWTSRRDRQASRRRL